MNYRETEQLAVFHCPLTMEHSLIMPMTTLGKSYAVWFTMRTDEGDGRSGRIEAVDAYLADEHGDVDKFGINESVDFSFSELKPPEYDVEQYRVALENLGEPASRQSVINLIRRATIMPIVPVYEKVLALCENKVKA